MSPQPAVELSDLILGQSMAGLAVPVMLFGPDRPASRETSPLADGSAGMQAYTREAYVAQCTYGQQILERSSTRSTAQWADGNGERLTAGGVLALNFHELALDNWTAALRLLKVLADVGPSWTPQDGHGPSAQDSPRGLQVFVGFYDGYRDTALWGADMCDGLGLRACFFPIFTATEPGEAGLQDADLTALAERHSIGFHTDSHLLVDEVDDSNVAVEVSGVLSRIRAATGRPAQLGAWCGGSRFDPSRVGNRALRAGGVSFLISNWSIENVPPSDPNS